MHIIDSGCRNDAPERQELSGQSDEKMEYGLFI